MPNAFGEARPPLFLLERAILDKYCRLCPGSNTADLFFAVLK